MQPSQLPAEPETPAPAPEAPKPDQFESALVALRKHGTPQGLIDRMTKDEILDYGSKAAKIIADSDNSYRQLLETSRAKETKESRLEPQGQTSKVNLKEAVAPFAQVYGDDAAEALEKSLSATAETIRGELHAQYEARVAGAEAAAQALLSELMRDRLTALYPAVETDDAAFGVVVEKAKQLAATGTYKNPRDLMRDAARLTLGEPTANNPALSQKRAAGQPTAESRQTTEKPRTLQDKEFEAWTALQRGASREEARRRAGL